MYYPVSRLRQIEQAALARGFPLMPVAGAATADFVSARFGGAAAILALVGPGNNGGDALVAATLLRQRGYPVQVAMPFGTDRLPPAAAKAYRAWRAAGGVEMDHLPDLPYQLILDGLFGIGLNRELNEFGRHLVANVNAMARPVLAVDVPSGVLADSGGLAGAAIRARWTLSFIGRARGLATGAALNYVGESHCHQLALPCELLGTGPLTTTETVAEPLHLHRLADTHKGSFGSVAVVGGAAGMAGACLLAGRAALQAGSGKVLVGMLDADGPKVDFGRPELMLQDASLSLLDKASVLLVGPGLGQSPQARQLLQAALRRTRPLVLDADALNLLAEHPDLQSLLDQRTACTVLTPHPSEAARLLGCETAVVQAQRFDAAKTLATRFKAVIVLKGAGSLVCEEGRCAVNRSGSAALANAGQGDVLGGLLAALLAQGLEGWPAANLAVWVHGAASDALRARDGRLLTLADDVAVEAGRILGRRCHPS
ncbi:NAD(P)H-hydrate dehydratase [Chitinimonas arctica]|uniref:Bifunctional NAD(P)H-hydrate repair enzyme n=1 Tax=Chitinimonas arctica TaxID=2594795 RepID=A0A516SHU9_9NEIS|nr:NAD(P)H-hydrate dehydratase [Chitinimonas arctica]QDQ27739.1 NAD(P)H-hydrate dehydratase [Chitinimonas arctica]